MQSTPPVTILIPNYKTLDLTKLCLRLIRKNTSADEAKVLVIDNNSADESLEYLRSLKWIELVERRGPANESGSSSHSQGLDMGLELVTTPYVLSIHTDTLVRNPGWIKFLVENIEKDDSIAGVGAWNLADRNSFKRIEKLIEYYGISRFYQTITKMKYASTGKQTYYYLRSHCALYRTALLKKYQLTFSDGGGSAGQAIHRELLQRGHPMIFLSPEKLLRYMEHVNHATSAMHPSIRVRKSLKKDAIRVQKAFQRFDAEKIFADESLDQ